MASPEAPQSRCLPAPCAAGADAPSLARALEFDAVLLRYQPIAALRTGRVVSVEVLPHWPDWPGAVFPEDGTPDAYAMAALYDSAGLGEAYGRWLLRHVCADLARWRAAGHAGLTACVTLTASQLADAGIAAGAVASLAAHGLAPGALTLQIKTVPQRQDACAGAGTPLLQELGSLLVLDDSAVSSLSPAALIGSHIGVIRIDAGRLPATPEESGEALLVRTVIAMAHTLGIQVAAKGLALQSQYDFLLLHLCDQVQGDLIATPLAAEAIDALLLEARVSAANTLRRGPQRSLLLVDDEQNILSSLRRLLRRDDYRIYCASSGEEGLQLLAQHSVDVIVSDQRMPGMLGSDFLRTARQLYPDTIRIMLSGYTELKSVTDAVNEGAIYKFLTKPWDDEQLRSHLAEAFRIKEIADDNISLNFQLRAANNELAVANSGMALLLVEKQKQISRHEISLKIAHELLEHLPLAAIGLDDERVIAFVNRAAEPLFAPGAVPLGSDVCAVLPELPPASVPPVAHHIMIDGRCYQVVSHVMGGKSASRGSLVTFSRCEVHR
jgi:EAL domain-containing protein (putative c-di-GMP-specific phosphodiesterase class I)/FixJ family two-component response regulator